MDASLFYRCVPLFIATIGLFVIICFLFGRDLLLQILNYSVILRDMKILGRVASRSVHSISQQVNWMLQVSFSIKEFFSQTNTIFIKQRVTQTISMMKNIRTEEDLIISRVLLVSSFLSHLVRFICIMYYDVLISIFRWAIVTLFIRFNCSSKG